MAMSAEHRSKFAALHRGNGDVSIIENLSSGMKNPKTSNKQINIRRRPFMGKCLDDRRVNVLPMYDNSNFRSNSRRNNITTLILWFAKNISYVIATAIKK